MGSEKRATALIVPCYIKSRWDIEGLVRLCGSIQKQSQPFDKVYFIDDASPLKYEIPNDFVEHIFLGDNGGPARARNVGINKAISSGAQHLLFTEHDCILDSDWNREMTSFLGTTEFGAVGGMTYSWGKTLLDRYHDLNGTLAGCPESSITSRFSALCSSACFVMLNEPVTTVCHTTPMEKCLLWRG